MLQKAELAAAMQTVMADLRYDITMEIIDDNPNDGFRMVCSIGDEIIDFEKIDIDSDGKIIVDVDHQEARGGTCVTSMREIVSKMRQHTGTAEATDGSTRTKAQNTHSQLTRRKNNGI